MDTSEVTIFSRQQGCADLLSEGVTAGLFFSVHTLLLQRFERREEQYVADRGAVREQHDQAVDAVSDASRNYHKLVFI